MIYADTVGDLGYAEELGNYAEYSGGPNQQVGAAMASLGGYAQVRAGLA